MQLRDYQEDLLARTRNSLRTNNRVLMVLPTGGGKTVIFSYMVSRAAAKGIRCVVLVHRDELIDQVAQTLQKFGVQCTFIAQGRPYRRDVSVVVASVFTLRNRLEHVESPGLIIVDEAHHCTLASSWGKVLTRWSMSKVVGVSATPERLSGEGLGQMFEDMVIGPTTSELIQRNALCPFEYYLPDTIDLSSIGFSAGDYNAKQLSELMNRKVIAARAVEAYRQIADGQRTVVFCVDLAHCQRTVTDYRTAGYKAEIIDGTLERSVRRNLVHRFATGEISHLISCNVVSEGFDLPAIECVQMLRPTASLALCLQQWGRGLRVLPGKKQATILDHVGNCKRHGFPDDDREWSLESKKRKRKTVSQAVERVKQCPKCYRAVQQQVAVCVCGHKFEPSKREGPEEVDGTMVAVSQEARAAMAKTRVLEQKNTRTLDGLIELGKQRGYKFPREWALKIFAARNNKLKTWQT